MCIVVMGVIVVLLTVRVKQNIVTTALICCFLKKKLGTPSVWRALIYVNYFEVNN